MRTALKNALTYTADDDTYTGSLLSELDDLGGEGGGGGDSIFGFGRGRAGGMEIEAASSAASRGYYGKLVQQRAKERHVPVPKTEAQMWASRRGTQVVGGKHWSLKSLAEMNARDWNIVREDNNIKIRGKGKGDDVPPLRDWRDLAEYPHFPPSLTAAIHDVGYENPTPIQMQALPLGLLGVDLIGLAETGSGKTAAFLLPALARLSYLPRATPEDASAGPYALILAPTRELAIQIQDEASKFSAEIEPPLRSAVIVGGHDEVDQLRELRPGVEIIIATPGRVNNLLENRLIAFARCFYIVLDEADRMIDMGFAPQVQDILDALPVTKRSAEDGDIMGSSSQVAQTIPDFRTTVMFSATMAPQVFHLAKEYMYDPVTVEIGKVGMAGSNIKQVVSLMANEKKDRALLGVLRKARSGLVIVFVNEKSTVNVVSNLISDAGMSCAVIHGGRTQSDRQSALAAFKARRVNVIVATDVLGRGIDVPNVTHVINYDMPRQMEVYTHRIGRTARAGKKGEAHTFLTEADSQVFYFLRKFLKDTKQIIPRGLEFHEAALIKPGTIAPNED